MQTNENHRKIMTLINQDLGLPSPPAIAVNILSIMRKDDFSMHDLAEVIAVDPSLSAKMLKVANSGIFACNGTISSINRAIAVLGTNIIKNIALSFVIAGELNSNGESGFDFEAFWRNSVTAAVSAELLLKRLDLKNEDLFVTALLQNIGMLVIAMTKGQEYGALIKEADNDALELLQLESDRYGYTHQQVGYALLQHWELPSAIFDPILYHHQPEKAPADCVEAATLLCFADRIATIHTTRGVGEKARLLQQQLQENYHLSKQQSLQLLDATAESSREMLAAFELDPQQLRPYSELLQEANAELGQLHLDNEQVLLEMKEAKDRAEKLTHELRDANSRLKELVYRDGLTGLYNHRYFQESLSNELARSIRYHSSLSLILFDIDHFKQVNDTYGHQAGDLVLMNLSRAVSSAVRPCDIISRYGGEEFAVILPETNLAGAKVFAARLRRCVEGVATLFDGQLIYVTISAGVTTFSTQTAGISKDKFIETADRGLYTSKQSGRNQVTVLELATSG